MCGVYTAYHAFDIPELTLGNKTLSATRLKMETLTFRIVLESYIESMFSELYKARLEAFQLCHPEIVKIIRIIFWWP